MTTVQSLAKLSVDLQALALAEENVKLTKKKKRKTKSLVKTGVQNIVGLNLIRETAKVAGSL